MSDDLRAPLPRAFERLADDLLIGRHADPHVAFGVLVYPDRAPAVITLTGRQSGAHDISHIKAGKKDEPTHDEGRFFVIADLEEASNALSDACLALRAYPRHTDKHLGMFIYDQIAAGWQRRRDYAMKREMDRAAEAARRPARCEVCGGRYTVRGIKAHQTKARYCARILAERATAAVEQEDGSR